jgi:hypothetical protein
MRIDDLKEFCMLFRQVAIITSFLFSVGLAGDSCTDSASGDGNKMGSDTAIIQGTVESVSPQDSMIVMNTENGTDTLYYNSETAFTFGDAKVLRPNTNIKVNYVKEGTRKVALRVQPAATGNGSASDTES